MKSLLLVLFSIFTCQVLLAQPGTLDNSFGQGGVVLTSMTDGYPECFTSIVQPDGKIIASGRFTETEVSNGFFDGFLLERYLSSGIIDTSFGDSGRIVTDFNHTYENAYHLALQPDGKILAAGYGYVNQSNPNYNALIARYLPDGSLDAGFGNGGKVVLDFGIGNDNVSNILILPNDKIMVCGYVTFHVVTLARYNSNGTLDESFGNNGTITTDLGQWPILNDAVLQADEKIVVAGSIGDGGAKKFLLMRYKQDGTLDESFGEGGKTITDFDVYSEEINALQIKADGKIIVAGYTGSNTINTSGAIARYESQGVLDNSFGLNGKVTTAVIDRDLNFTDIIIDGHNNIVVSSRYDDVLNPISDFAILRYKSTGLLDSTFSADGIAVTDLGFFENAWSVNLNIDGDYILAGQSIGDEYQIALTQYKGGEVEKEQYVRIKKWLHRHGFTWEDKPGNEIRYYSVQRSNNGNFFKELARVFRGTNSQLSFEDANSENGTSYYRVASVLMDNSVNYSNVLSLDYNRISIRVYPNPAKNFLQIEGLSSTESSRLSIYDINGNVRLTATASAPVFSWNIGTLQKGSYVVTAQLNGVVVKKKFLKE